MKTKVNTIKRKVNTAKDQWISIQDELNNFKINKMKEKGKIPHLAVNGSLRRK